ncbi:MAG: hypothetical protein Q9171_002943 [Xanthocarpia ochracea]
MSKSQLATRSAKIDQPICSLPTEILDKVIISVISNDTPVHLEYLMENVNHITMLDLFRKPPNETTKLDRFQLVHQRDWVFVNSVCRSWRFTGQKAFFSRKTFLITNSLMKALVAGRLKLLTTPNHPFNVLESIRYIIVPMPGWSATSNLLVLPRYHAFSNLQSVDILTYVRMDEILDDYCIPGFWTFWCDKEPDGELMECLAGVELRVDELRVRFSYVTLTESIPTSHLQRMQGNVVPYLRFVNSQKAKLRARQETVGQ